MSSTLLYKMLVGAVSRLWASLVLAGIISAAAKNEAPGAVPTIVFMHYGGVAPAHALCVLQARRSNPSANITVITHKDSDLKAWEEIAADTGVSIYKPADWDILKKFEAVYKHSSINGYDKEMYCIYRHLMLHHYMMEQSVPSIIYLDLDIAVFDDLTKLIPPDSTVSKIGTFAVHWTYHSLSAFAHYIWHFYQREPLEVAAKIAEVGRLWDIMPRPASHEQKAKDPFLSWWPKDMPRYHISDMWMFLNFIQTTGALKVLCPNTNMFKYNPQCPPALQLMRNLRQHQMLKGHEGSYTVAGIHRLFKWLPHPRHKYHQPVMSSNTTKGIITTAVPGIHFQGTSKPILAPLLCKDLLSHFAQNPALQRICQNTSEQYIR